MISNRLSFNFKLFKEEYKKYIWAVALTFLGFLFTKIILPLLDYSSYLSSKKEILNEAISEQLIDERLKESLEYKLNGLNNYLTLDYELNKFLVICLAILLGTVIFSYLHNKKKVDFYHSLPISRTNLFITKYFLGIAIVVPIMILSHFILYFAFKMFLGSYIVPFKEVLEPVLVDTLFFIVIYSITIFATILCGNTIIGVILSGILLNLFSIISINIYLLNEVFFRGKIVLYYIFSFNAKYNPIFAYIGVKNTKQVYDTNINDIIFSNIYIVITYIFVALIFIILSLFLFKVRKSEQATNCIAFKYVKTILKYLGVVIGSITLGVIFVNVSRAEISIYLGIIIGCIVLHCIVEIIYDFDFRAAFKNWYSMIGCAIICLAIIFIYQFDIFNRVEYIPDVEKIESVTLRLNDEELDAKNVTDPEFINYVVNFHQIHNDLRTENGHYEQVMSIQYRLKNNFIVGRNVGVLYTNIDKEKQEDLYRQMLNNKAFIESVRPILYTDNITESIYRMEIYNNKGSISKFGLNYDKLLENIKKDIEKNGLYVPREEVLFYISFYFDGLDYGLYNDYTSFYINEKYTNTLNYLASVNIYPENYKSEDVERIYLRDEYKGQYLIEITDKGEIEKILSNYKLYNLKGVPNYDEYRSLILVDNADNEIEICINIELFEELSEDYQLSTN